MLLAQTTASNTASIEFALPLGFRKFRISTPNFVPATDGASLWLRLSIDGGSTYANTSYVSAGFGFTAAAHGHGDGGTTAALVLTTGVGNAAGESGTISLALMGMETGKEPVTLSRICRRTTDGALNSGSFVSRYSGSTDRVTHVQLLCSSGNISSGTFYLYGDE